MLELLRVTYMGREWLCMNDTVSEIFVFVMNDEMLVILPPATIPDDDGPARAPGDGPVRGVPQ